MQVSGNQTVEISTLDAAVPEGALTQDEAKWFVIWACLWIAALAILLPALI